VSEGLPDALLLAFALAMDATAVAAARGVAGIRRIDALRMAGAFGVLQAAMAAAGWGLGSSAARWIARWDHWIAFALLALLGGKMLLGAACPRAGEAERALAPLSAGVVLVLAVAVSIDALAAGVALPMLEAPEVVSVGLIGAVAFVLSLVGALGARRIGRRGGRVLEAIGGVTLVGIGAKILVEHLA
jgi:putative Mn2+ efflux pump MntP